MIRLTIGNSTCSLTGLTVTEFKAIRTVLSYTEQVRGYRKTFRQARHYLMDRRGNFPTGLLYLVDDYFAKKGTLHTVVRSDNRKRPKPIPGLFTMRLPHTPYPEQIEASEACKTHGRGICVAPTGVGKSTIAALIINALQVRSLLVVPTLELRRQLTDSLGLIFGKDKVGSLPENRDIAVENVDALDPEEPLVGYDSVIIDEFHHSGAATYRKLNQKAWSGVYFKVGLTATAFRSKDTERLLLESVLSQVIYRIEYKAAVEKGYIVPLEAYYFTLPKQKMKGNARSWPAVSSELIVNNVIRNKVIAHLLRSFFSAGISTLALVREIKHGENLVAETGAAFANGQNEDCQALIAGFNQRKLTALIGTIGVLGEGVDTKPAEVAILAAGGKSKNAFMQQCGRTFRVHPGKDCASVFLFRDVSNKWLAEHFNAQCRYLKEEYGVEAQPLELPEGIL